MRCKRCGEMLEPMDTRCPVCGKTVAPRKKAAPPKKPENTIKLPQLDKLTRTYQQDSARSRTLQMVTIAAIVVVLAMLVMVYVCIGDMQTAVADLRQSSDAQFQAILNQPQQDETPDAQPEAEPQTDPAEPTEGETAPALPLSRQDMEAVLKLTWTADRPYAAAAMDLGSFEDQAQVWVSTDVQDGIRRTDAVWMLENSGDWLRICLEDRFGGSDTQYFAAMTWNMKGGTLGSMAGPVCVWEYRVPGGQWESFSGEYLTAVGGGCELRLTAEQLADLIGQYNQLELRCQVSVTHPDGGILRLAAEGMTINRSGMVEVLLPG